MGEYRGNNLKTVIRVSQQRMVAGVEGQEGMVEISVMLTQEWLISRSLGEEEQDC